MRRFGDAEGGNHSRHRQATITGPVIQLTRAAQSLDRVRMQEPIRGSKPMEYRRKLRDLGAAATFGWSSTARKKDAEAEHQARQKEHEKQIDSYAETVKQTQSSVEKMDANFKAAQEVLLSEGALVSDADGNITYGWFRPQEGVQENRDYTISANEAIGAAGSIGAFGIGIGTPAVIWGLVGVYGTAATGTAIGALSGAAIGTATAAWIGRGVTLGMGGMTAGRIALGPIGIAASLLTLPVGAYMAGRNEKDYIKRVAETASKMEQLETIIEKCRSRLAPLQSKMAVVTSDMQRHTSQAETATAGTPEAQEAVNRLKIDMEKAASINNEITDIGEECEEAMKNTGFAKQD